MFRSGNWRAKETTALTVFPKGVTNMRGCFAWTSTVVSDTKLESDIQWLCVKLERICVSQAAAILDRSITCQQQHRHARVDDGEPVNLQVLGQERVARVLLHAAVEGDAGLLPLHGERELNRDGLALSDVHSTQGISGHIDFDDTIVVVRDVEVYVGEQIVPHLGGLAGTQDLLHFADETPQREVIVIHLFAKAHQR
eukprot:7115786-Pyramimonas_sp.AAC.2